MEAVEKRFNYLFRSTQGLILVAIALIALITAIWGTLSGPLAEWGFRDITVRLLGMDLIPGEREGRIIMLYHSIALAVVAIETYIITDMVAMRPAQRSSINNTMTVGYLAAMFGGMGFAYFGHNWVLHGIFIAGQSLVFFAGILLAVALWPDSTAHANHDPDRAHIGKIDLERVAFFTMAIATLGSAVFGAVAGAFFGNGFQSFLAEDIIREPHKTGLQRSIIGHLHIMLTLIGVAATLIIGRWFDFKGIFHKIAMPLMIVGTIVISLGAWSVVWVRWAHTIIYVGSVGVMLAGLMLVIFAWDKLIRTGQTERGGVLQKLKALLRDPLRFGATWQMVFMNFTVSGIGIYMAAKLDEIFRVWPHRDERITLTGHWHILSALIATILLCYYADYIGLKGRARQWFGWVLIIGSDLAFGAMTVYEIKRLFVSESLQQPLVDWTLAFSEVGLGALMVALAIFLLWRLYDLVRQRGLWLTNDETHQEGQI